MGVAGAKAKPLALHLIAGTIPESSDPGPEFPPVEQFPAPPAHIPAYGVEIWNRLGPELVAAGVLQVVDLLALEQLCYAWHQWSLQARAGDTISAAENTSLRMMLAEFGCTPSSRRRIPTSGNKDKANRFDKFKGKGTAA